MRTVSPGPASSVSGRNDSSSSSRVSVSGGRVTAVLGPTNTGKTHFALERMMGHASGMIGFPLRLLARETYERVAAVKGAAQVALITGEEKIVPPHPRYFLCTVESMPVERRVSFLAVDEIQLCADPERGHIFTDRLLHARGDSETVFLGAETIRPLICRLVPGIEFIARPRFSQLTYTGPRKLTRLPPRSAVVAFSAGEVYAMAEFVRRQRGGAAVVLGALSPRTRNAQVGLFQAGEVDYIVATDAIGMGLNMDVDHVAFAALRKFDGRSPRDLEAPELAQIAGRAGRYMNDGTFGTTADAGAIPPETVAAIESHRFPPLKTLWWRNADLRFTSVAALLSSLDRPPAQAGLSRAREADDQRALAQLAQEPAIAALARSPDQVRLLWEVCRIPDFRKAMAESHPRLLAQIFAHLAGPDGRLPTDWLAARVGRLDRTDGDLDTLVGRIAHVRTWTYVVHRAMWVEDPVHWQGVARAIEDRLSDALHERLTQRFVDRRTAVLLRRMRESDPLSGAVAGSGEVTVEGHAIGRLDGFRFAPDTAQGGVAARAVLAAAGRALKPEIAQRVTHLVADGDEAFALEDEGILSWRGEAVARLVAGPDRLRPQVEPFSSDLLEPAARDRVRKRLAAWLAAWVARAMHPLADAGEWGAVSGAMRGLLHQLAEGLGSVPRRSAAAQVEALDEAGRARLTRMGVRFGVESVFLPALLKPGPLRLRAILWSVQAGQPGWPAPDPGRVAVDADPAVPTGFYEAVGYRVAGPKAVRVDMLERFAAEARRLDRAGRAQARNGAGYAGFVVGVGLSSTLGVSAAEAGAVLSALGFRRREGEGGPYFLATRLSTAGGRAASLARPERAAPRGEDSPFACLRR